MAVSSASPPALSERHEHHGRLLEGMAKALAQKGYADTTIADIVREASVSRRSFYENFDTKADCLLALYEVGSAQALEVLRQAIDPNQPWQTQVRHAVTAYLDCLAQNPVLLKTLFVEILGLGLPGLAVRQRVNAQIAAFIQNSTGDPQRPRLPASVALALVGGINELILEAVVEDRSSDLRALVEPATQLILAVAGSATTGKPTRRL